MRDRNPLVKTVLILISIVLFTALCCVFNIIFELEAAVEEEEQKRVHHKHKHHKHKHHKNHHKHTQHNHHHSAKKSTSTSNQQQKNIPQKMIPEERSASIESNKTHSNSKAVKSTKESHDSDKKSADVVDSSELSS